MGKILVPLLVIGIHFGCGQPAPDHEGAGETRVSGPTVGAALPEECNPDPPCPGSTCPTAIDLSLAKVPVDACPRFGEFQSDVDVFSWNSFIALNWPADPSSCSADDALSILDGVGPVVWQTYAEDTSIFVSSGKPAPWCSNDLTAPLDFTHTAKASASIIAAHQDLVDGPQPSILEAVGGPLTDQNGRFVRYQKLVNQDEYDYIVDNGLWNRQGQVGQQISFPQEPVGATEIKAAWKVLSQDEIDGGRFYTTQGTVYNDADGSPSPGSNPVTLGLVGLHIIHKTRTQKTWFWSTFEHVDNTTSSFYNPDCSDCQDNVQTAAKPYTELDPGGTPINDPVQVTRVTPIAATALNAYYQGLLAGSVWANFELVSTQWATGGAPDGTPPILANTTMETFNQDSSSCMGCHKFAQTTDKQNADFSFLLGEAQ